MKLTIPEYKEYDNFYQTGTTLTPRRWVSISSSGAGVREYVNGELHLGVSGLGGSTKKINTIESYPLENFGKSFIIVVKTKADHSGKGSTLARIKIADRDVCSCEVGYSDGYNGTNIVACTIIGNINGNTLKLRGYGGVIQEVEGGAKNFLNGETTINISGKNVKLNIETNSGNSSSGSSRAYAEAWVSVIAITNKVIGSNKTKVVI